MDYNHHMACVDKGDRIANSYSISRCTFKWTKKLFFHLLDLAVLNSYVLHSSCGWKKISHRDFRYILMKNTLAHAGPERRVPRPLGRPPNVESHITMLEVCNSKHWPTLSETKLRCRMCKARGVTKKFSWSAVWHGTVCETNMFQRLPHRGTIVRTPGVTSLRKIWASRQYVSKGNWKFSMFHIITMCNCELKIITGFLNTCTIISVVSQKKCCLIHYLILFGSRNINIVCKTY